MYDVTLCARIRELKTGFVHFYNSLVLVGGSREVIRTYFGWRYTRSSYKLGEHRLQTYCCSGRQHYAVVYNKMFITSKLVANLTVALVSINVC